MEKMIVVVFGSESKAYEGMGALKQLDSGGDITVHAAAVMKKNPDGKVTLLKTSDEFPVGTVGGTAIGSLVGLLGGPVGVLAGASTGTLLGASRDLYRSGVNADFIDDISIRMIPGTYAVAADISEDWITPLDVEMEKHGGLVFRAAKSQVEEDQMEADMASLDFEIAQLEREMKEANAERKAKLQAKIDRLKEKRQKKKEQARKRLEEIKEEHDAKVRALKEKAAKARSERKAAIETWAAQINKEYQDRVQKLKNLEADRLEKTADRLDERAKKLRG